MMPLAPLDSCGVCIKNEIDPKSHKLTHFVSEQNTCCSRAKPIENIASSLNNKKILIVI